MYLGLFEKREDVCRQFGIEDFDGTVLFAAYTDEEYSGDAVVIFVQQGQFYYVAGSHCSCFGLEGQWSPEAMSLEALIRVIREGGSVLNEFGPQIETALRVVEGLALEDAPPLHVEIAVRLAFS